MNVDEITFRMLKEEDLKDVERIENSSFKYPWPLEALKFELLENPFCISLALESSGKFIGYAFLHIASDFSHLVNIAIEKNFRGIGLGEKFLRHILKVSRNAGVKRVVLEVRKSNIVAIKLYEKVGFSILREQKAYYQDGESALIMAYELK